MIPPIASRFVAGETDSAAIEHTKSINQDGIAGILNLLGEHYTERAPADEDRNAYLDLIDRVAGSSVEACISIKPSQIGLDVAPHVFQENLEEIVTHAADQDVFVWIDMEDHETTDPTLDGFENMTTKHDGGVGICVQANLKRTEKDLRRLSDLPGKVRLVKGAYDEPENIAYQRKDRVDEAYRERLRFMFESFDDGIAVGSHDPAMVTLARELHEEYGTPFEIQMLMGVREDAQRELASEYDVYQYIPYGDKWLSYFYRRVMERKENLLFALRAIFSK
ncbi:MAG: proline dehydrogenase family protein [Halobacteriaceae archaeon]